MIVKYLELENYRRFEKVQLELPQGIIGIIGLNGCGKSTLVEAIAWALYGNEPPITRTKKGEVKRAGAAKKDPCRVVLEFVLSGDNYRLVREIRGGATQSISAELQINNRTEATGAKPVTELLENRLGMDYKSFFASVFARQKELNALSSETPNVRKKLVLRMLNIEFLEKVKATVGKDKRYSIKFIEGLKAGITDPEGKDYEVQWLAEQKDLTTAQTSLKKVLKALEKDRNTRKKELAGITKEFEVYEKKYSSYKKQKAELEKLEKELTKHNAELDGYKRELAKLKKEEAELSKLEVDEKKYRNAETEHGKLEGAAELHNQHESLKKQIKAGDEKVAKLKTQHDNFSRQLEFFAELDAELSQLELARAKLEAAMVDVNDKISRQAQTITQLSGTIKEKTDHKNNIKNMGPDSTCPTCERPLDEHLDFLLGKIDGELDDKSKELRSLEDSLKDLKSNKKDLDKEKIELKKKDKQLSDSKLKREEVTAKLGGFASDIKELESELKALNKELKGLPDDIFDQKRFSDVKKQLIKFKDTHERYIALKGSVSEITGVEKSIMLSGTKVQEAEGRLQKLGKELKALGFDEDEYQRSSEKRLEASTYFQEAEKELSMKTGELEHSREKLEGLEKRLSELGRKKEEIAGEEEKVAYLSTLEVIMDKFKTNLISRIRPLLSQYGSEFLIKLTDGKYSELELNEDYEILIFDDGEKYELKRFSGGEEDIANLCIRLAISRVIAESAGTTGVNMIILDEIFGSQDIYRKRNIVSLLNELTNQYQQIFLITHVEEMKERMGYVIDVSAEGEDDVSTVKILN
jgi:exonuclease SbcC